MVLMIIMLIMSDIKKLIIYEMDVDEVLFVLRVERVVLFVKILRIIIIYLLIKYWIILVMRVIYNYNNNFWYICYMFGLYNVYYMEFDSFFYMNKYILKIYYYC